MTDFRKSSTEAEGALPGRAADLLDLSTRLIASPDLKTLASEAVQASVTLHRADFGNLQLVDPATGKLCVAGQQGFSTDCLDAFAVVSAHADCACGRALRHREAVAISDVEQDRGFAPYRIIAARAGFRAVQSTPLIDHSGDVLGVLSTYFRQPHVFSSGQMQTIAYYARQAAEMVARCRRESAARQAAEQQMLLGEELRHRVRNLLTVIEAISWETARGNPAPEDFTAIFTGRLRALYRAQNLLMDLGAAGCDIRMLLREQLMLPESDARVSCSGPALTLNAADSLDLGLLFYELGTNARKYGALSSTNGRVSVEWKLPRAADNAALKLRWSERGGPPVETPASQGFGSKLIRRISRENASLRFDPAGLTCEVTIPLRSAALGKFRIGSPDSTPPERI